MRPIHTLHALAVVALRRTNFVVIKIALRDFPPLLFPALMVLGGLSIIAANPLLSKWRAAPWRVDAFHVTAFQTPLPLYFSQLPASQKHGHSLPHTCPSPVIARQPVRSRD